MINELDEFQREKLRQFTDARYLTVHDLTAALRDSLSFSPVAQQGDHVAKTELILATIQNAHSEGWDSLLAFCLIFHRASGGDAKTLAGKLFSAEIRAGLQLLDLLNVDTISDEEVGGRFQMVARTWWPEPAHLPGGMRTKAIFAYLLASAQESADPGDRDVATCPLGSFLKALMSLPNLNDSIQTKIRATWLSIATELSLTGDLPAPGELLNNCYSVLVELRETDDSTPHSPRWLRAAWLHTHGSRQAPQPLDVGDPNARETELTVVSYLAALRDHLAARKIPLSKTTFEFFVSQSSLLQAIDRWEIPLEGFREVLGDSYPVVIRNGSRSEASGQKLQERWKRIRNAAALEPVAHVARGCRDADGNITFKMLNKSPEVVCMLVESPLDTVDELTHHPCIPAAMVAGIPVILWARRGTAVPDLPAQLTEWCPFPPRELPHLLRDLRNACPPADPTHLGGHVTLLFENADYSLPEKLTAAEAHR